MTTLSTHAAHNARRRWSAAEKLRIVEESFSAPRLASATARRHGISNQLLFAWRKVYREGRLGDFRRERAGVYEGSKIGRILAPSPAHRFTGSVAPLFCPAWPTTPHTIDRWDDATGENLIEQIAAVCDYLVALATYRAAVKRWPKDKITLRNRARVIEQSWRD